jgi:hypothetical protein
MDSINLPFLLINSLLVVHPLLPLVLLILPSPNLLHFFFPSPNHLVTHLTGDMNTSLCYSNKWQDHLPLE